MTPPFASRACGASSPLRPPSAPASSVVRREFPVRGARLLGLTIEPAAVVTVTGWDQDRVVVQVSPDGDGPPLLGGLEFVCGATERGPLWVHAYDARVGAERALRVDVRVPRHFSLVLNAPRATVLAEGVEGAVTRNEGAAARHA